MKGCRASAAVAAAVAALCVVPLAAQQLESGTRIRITAPAVPLVREVGLLVWMDQDSLVAEAAGSRYAARQPVAARWVVPRELITELDVSRGSRGHAGRGFLIGAGVGLAGGLIAISGEGTCTGSGNYGELCVMAVVGSTLAGGLVGLIVGAVARTEAWQPLSLR